MKKTLLLSLLAGLTYLTMVSYKSGPANGGAGNRTGGPGSGGNTCTAGGCHGPAAGNTHIAISLMDEVSGETITDGKYEPLRTYVVTLTVHNASMSNFGFQAEALDANDNSAGILVAGSGQRTATAGGKKIIEHSAPITGTSNTTFRWTSPHAGAGTVTFYIMGNAVNLDNQTTGDEPSAPYSESFTENNTSVASVIKNIDIVAYPNPVNNQLNLKLENTTKGNYIINGYSLNGTKLFENNVLINGAKYETSIQTDKWAPGVYYVQIIKDGIKHISTIVKQ